VLAFAVLGLWLTYIAGRRLFDGRIGFLAIAVQASSYLYFVRSAWLDDDLLFAVFVQLGVTGFALSTRKGASRWWPLFAWLGLAGCALTKSAILGVGLVVPTVVLFLFLEAGLYGVQLGISRARRWPGVLLFLALVAPWYAWVALHYGKTLVEEHLLGQHLARLSGTPRADVHPPYYYLLVLAVGFFPWSLFVPLGVVHGKDRMKRPGERLCIVWAVTMIVAFLFVPTKKWGYILVVWPPLALLISAAFFEAKEWFSLWENYLRQGVFKAVPVLMKAPLFLVLLVALFYLTGSLEVYPRLEGLLADRSAVLRSLGVVAVASGVVFAMASRVRRFLAAGQMPAAALELACGALVLLVASSFFHEGRNELLSSRAVLERFSAQIPQGASVAVYGRREPEILYYMDRPDLEWIHVDYFGDGVVEDPEFRKLEELLSRPKEAFVVTSGAELLKLRSYLTLLERPIHEKLRGEGGRGREYVLLATTPGPLEEEPASSPNVPKSQEQSPPVEDVAPTESKPAEKGPDTEEARSAAGQG
jgi:4-amino-4-deoxy-L-arabinose transferase-like glycosyltransferase